MKNMQQQLLHEQTIKEEEEHNHHQGGDLDDERKDGFVKIESNPSYINDQSMNSCWEEDGVGVMDGGGDGDEDLLNDALMSYEDFLPLPDFPCISSSSSSSSSSSHHPHHPHQHQHAAVTCTPSSSSTTSSASSSASWAMMKTDHHHHHHEHAAAASSMISTDHHGSMEIHHQNSQDEAEMINRMNSAECMDVLEGLGDMDLLDTDDMWDPSSLFPYEQVEQQQEETKDHHQQVLVQQADHQEEKDQKEDDHQFFVQRDGDHDDDEEEEEEGDQNKPSEDLAMVFLEWLKSNKESISAEDLRSIKLRRSTIECAAKRLGSGKEGMKQLLKLILEWVQNHHLQKKRDQASSLFPHQENPHQQSFQNSNPNPNSITTSPSWVSSLPPYDHSLMYPPPPPSMLSYMHGAHDSSLFAQPPFNPTTNLTHVNPYSSSSSTHDYNMFDSSTTSPSPNWPSTTSTPPPPQPPPHFSISSSSQYMHQDSHLVPPQPVPTLQRSFSNYPSPQMFQGGGGTGTGGEGSLMRLGSSATKEARKKRMARQRKLFSHHHRSTSTSSTHHQHQQTRLVVDNSCTTITTTPPTLPLPIPNQAMNHQVNNWVYWHSSPSPTSVAASSLDPSPLTIQNHQQNYHKQHSFERRHGCKPVEKNLKFLLQKVLKQSDVGTLGRIVLPKKEAETYLPELEARDGITIAMEDIGTSRIWNMRYRFWPNNKSRMYLLENTGDFVRSNGLQEGDFIVIYSDVKCGKYMIRGVKVRQPGSKCEVKKSTKELRDLHHSNSLVFDPSSSSFKQTVT